jgi:cyclophilin family peptidyl-prolyl cis-trans isomerase
VLVLVLTAVAVVVYQAAPSGSGSPPPGPATTTPARSVSGAPKTADSPNAVPGTVTTAGHCSYTATPTAGRSTSLPPPAGSLSNRPEHMVVTTNGGDIKIQLDVERAPCAVYALRHLAAVGYYSGTVCPPEPVGPAVALPLLRCGATTNDLASSPGFTYPAESTGPDTFDAGVVAMLPVADGSNGAQFVISYATPSDAGLAEVSGRYTVVGYVIDGMTAVNWLVNNSGTDSAGGGQPPVDAQIKSVTISP